MRNAVFRARRQRPIGGCAGDALTAERALVLIHGEDAAAVAGSALPHAPLVGIGLRRPGLDGAKLSVGDAEQALTIMPSTGGVSSFADQWLAVCLSPQRHWIAPLLEHGGEIAPRSRP